MNLRKILSIFCFILIFTLLITGFVLVSRYNNSESNTPIYSNVKTYTPSGSTPVPQINKSYNILVTCEEAGVADDIFILNYSPDTNNVNLLTIPGNYKTIEGIKMSATLGDKGALGLINNLKANFDLSIKYYVKFDYTAFVEIINILDGVTYAIPYDFKSATTNLSSNQSVYSGKMAVELFRFRDPFDNKYTKTMLESSYDGTQYKRTLMHADFIFALLTQKANSEYLSKIQEIITTCGKRIETNLTQKNIDKVLEDAPGIIIKRINQYIIVGVDENDLNGFFKFSNLVKEVSVSEREYELSYVVETYFKSDSIA